MLTFDQARRLYLVAGGDPDHEPEQWAAVRCEMQAVAAAPTLAAAAKVIRWWDC